MPIVMSLLSGQNLKHGSSSRSGVVVVEPPPPSASVAGSGSSSGGARSSGSRSEMVPNRGGFAYPWSLHQFHVEFCCLLLAILSWAG